MGCLCLLLRYRAKQMSCEYEDMPASLQPMLSTSQSCYFGRPLASQFFPSFLPPQHIPSVDVGTNFWLVGIPFLLPQLGSHFCPPPIGNPISGPKFGGHFWHPNLRTSSGPLPIGMFGGSNFWPQIWVPLLGPTSGPQIWGPLLDPRTGTHSWRQIRSPLLAPSQVQSQQPDSGSPNRLQLIRKS